MSNPLTTFVFLFLCLFFIACPSGLKAQGLTVIDDSGSTIVLNQPAKRVVSLYPALTEIVARLGLESRIVGATAHDPLIQKNKGVKLVGTHMRPSLEIIMGLKPDLVLQGSSRHDALMVTDALKRRSIPVALFRPHTFDQMFSSIRKIGLLLGAETESECVVKELSSALSDIKRRYPPPDPVPKVFFEINRTNLLAAGTQNIVNDIILLAGGRNIVNVPKRIVRYNREEILRAQPDIYIIQKGPMNRGGSTEYDSSFFSAIPAFSKGNVLLVDEFLFSRPAPNAVKAVEVLAKFIHEHFPSQQKKSAEN